MEESAAGPQINDAFAIARKDEFPVLPRCAASWVVLTRTILDRHVIREDDRKCPLDPDFRVPDFQISHDKGRSAYCREGCGVMPLGLAGVHRRRGWRLETTERYEISRIVCSGVCFCLGVGSCCVCATGWADTCGCACGAGWAHDPIRGEKGRYFVRRLITRMSVDGD